MKFKLALPVFLFLILFAPHGFSETAQIQPPSVSAEEILHKIETRRGTWTDLKAAVSMEFITPQKKTAACRADLAYARLEEKILLKGFNAQNKLLFVFKTSDRNFELYLPSSKTLYRGSIFDLEDSPEIHSHLKALDLYRALKPLAVSAGKAAVTKNPGDTAGGELLKVESSRKGKIFLARELTVTKDGEVSKEAYYTPEGKPGTLIERSDFKTIGDSQKDPAFFPSKITLASPSQASGGDLNQTTLVFDKISFNASLSDADFDFSLPQDTRIVELEENQTEF